LIIPIICASVKRLFLITSAPSNGQTLHQIKGTFGGQVNLNCDTINGGLGSDRLELNTAGVLGAAALSGMSGVETIQLAAGTNGITFLNGNLTGVVGGKLTVFGSSGNDTIDATGLTGSNAVLVTSGAGLDVLRGGAGVDTFRFAAADFDLLPDRPSIITRVLRLNTMALAPAQALRA